jgi:hypothetical protein
MTSRIPTSNAPRLSTAPSSIKPRQLVRDKLFFHFSIFTAPSSLLKEYPVLTQSTQSHLHAQLAQLSANLADLENLLRMTSVQAESIRGLGAFHGGLCVAYL